MPTDPPGAGPAAAEGGSGPAIPGGEPMAAGRARLARHWAAGCALLGSRHAIMAGAMSWVSERALVSAVSNAGGFGVIACGSMGPDLLGAEIAATRERTDAPFGVNLITMHPELEALIDTCAAHRVSHVILAGGLPRAAAIKRIKDSGARVLCFAPALALARKLVRMGVDGLIIEGMEAGGHIGPVSTGVLAQEILPEIRDVPVLVAGGIGRGEAIAAYLELGASGCQLGTRFVCAGESVAHPAFKKAVIRANARDAQVSVQLDPRFPVIPVRALANGASRRFAAFQREIVDRYHAGELGLAEAQLKIEKYWVGALRLAVIDGDVEAGSMMAGQSVGMVRGEETCAEIVSALVDQAAAALALRRDA